MNDNLLFEEIRLKQWLNDIYDAKVAKLLRLIRLNNLCDDGTNPNNILKQLDLEAESKRQRIKEIEKLK